MKKLELKNIIREEVKIAKKIYEANRDVTKVYKPGDKISIKKYNNFDKKQEIIHGKVESVKNGVIKYTYTNFAGQQWGTVKVGDTNIVETSASGNAGPYMTSKAFTKPGQDYEGSPAANAMKDWTKTKRIDESKESKIKSIENDLYTLNSKLDNIQRRAGTASEKNIFQAKQQLKQKIDKKKKELEKLKTEQVDFKDEIVEAIDESFLKNVPTKKLRDTLAKLSLKKLTNSEEKRKEEIRQELIDRGLSFYKNEIVEDQMKFSWPNVGIGDKIVDINDEKFKVLRKEKNRIFVKDLQSPNDEFWIEKDYAVKHGKYIIEEQVDFKDENFSPKQKMAQAIRTVRESLKEVEKIVDKSRVFKEENNIKSIDMYKRSHAALKKIGEQMNRISNKLQAVK